MRKKVVVLGGSSGIGKATAERFAREGWQVLVAAHSYSECLAAVNKLEGESHIACEVDVRKDEDLAKLQHLIEDKFKNFDCLVNTVGISESNSAVNSDFSAWDNSLQVMLYGTVKACRY